MFNLMGRRKVDDQQRAFSVGNLPLEVRVFVLVWPNSFCCDVLICALEDLWAGLSSILLSRTVDEPC